MNFIPIHFNAETFRAGWDVPFLQMLFFLLFFNLRQARFLFVFLNKHRVSVFLYRNERVISNYPPSFKAMSDRVWIRYHSFCFFKLFIFICWFLPKVTCAFLAYKTQHLLSQNNEGNVHIFDQFKTSRILLQIGHCHLCITFTTSFKWS